MMKPMEYFKKSLKLCFLLLLCTMLLPACTYDSDDDNFHELQKPTEQVEIGVDLAGVNPKETIYCLKMDTKVIFRGYENIKINML